MMDNLEKGYNRLVIVGNGLDLALGLKTTYNDFMLDYLKTCYSTFIQNSYCETPLIKLHTDYSLGNRVGEWLNFIHNVNTIENLIQTTSQIAKKAITHKLFEDLIGHYTKSNWIDIEQYYYELLRLHFDTINSSKKGSRKNYQPITLLNKCLDQITEVIESYISVEQQKLQINHKDPKIDEFIDALMQPIENDHEHQPERIDAPDHIMFLNFNYTNCVEKLLDNESPDYYSHVSIHGQVDHPSNPIIFGYGDDTSDEYKQLETANNDELLRKIKSFQYPNTYNYDKLLAFINSNIPYEVFIVGHSCGLSDRTMLKSIFENESCIAIKIFHYKQTEIEQREEVFYKGMAISRHFTDKPSMRSKVLTFDPKASIPQIKN